MPPPPWASFRDPSGSVSIVDGRVLRTVMPEAARDVLTFLGSEIGRRLIETGRLVRSDPLDGNDTTRAMRGSLIIEHAPILYPTFPYEWPPALLLKAADLTLGLAEELLPAGYGLKDATPYNVMFRGPHPQFIDLLSIEPRDPHNRVWNAYGQFVRTFLLPLLAYRYRHLVPGDVLTTRRDGLGIEEARRLFGFWRGVTRPTFSLVTIPGILSGVRSESAERYALRLDDNPDRARFVLRRLFAGLRKALTRAIPRGERSAWADYYRPGRLSYSGEEFMAKAAFVRAALEEIKPHRVLDIGCNAGYFSEIAARTGAAVLATDRDPVVLDALVERATREDLNILPLAIDIARPTPALGWLNSEHPSFLDRFRERFDAVLMLAVVHHIRIGEQVPLDRIVALAADLTSRHLIVEYVGPTDPQFQTLLRGREALFRDDTHTRFEEIAVRRFSIVRAQQVPGRDRWLYLMEKRSPDAFSAT